MFKGRILAIRVAHDAKALMQPVDYVLAAPGKGLVGDRYAEMKGAFQRGTMKPHQEVTLIENEAITAVAREYELSVTHADTRRNLLTEGVPLNHLVGKTFRVGEVLLRGIKLCEPCSYLESLTQPGIETAFRHRGGLRAQVVGGGIIRIGDTVQPDAAEANV